MNNEITVYDDAEIVKNFKKLTEFHKKIGTNNDKLIKISKNDYMSMNLKSDGKKNFKIHRVYSFDIKNKKIIDETFDIFHRFDKMEGSRKFIFFDFFVFVIGRTIEKNDKKMRKKQTIIDIRNLNFIIQKNVYSMSTQTNITAAVIEVKYISILNVLAYFYQGKIKPKNKHKTTMISHRKQEQFNVAIMNFTESSAHAQRQTDRMLTKCKNYAKSFINDIMIFFNILKKHLQHFDKVFIIFEKYDVTLNPNKIYVEYLFLMILNQIIDEFDLITTKKKIRAIFSLIFSQTLKNLKYYLRLIEGLRFYIFFYAQIVESLQRKKTYLLRSDFVKDNPKKFYFKKIKFSDFITTKMLIYDYLQNLFAKFIFLAHYSVIKRLFVNVNVSKQMNFETMIFHVKNDSSKEIVFKKTNIQSIMFLSKCFSIVERNYGPTELKTVDVMGIVKKIKHLIQSSKSSTIIFTNHSATADIVAQTKLFIISTNKFNLRFVKIFQFFSFFFLQIKIKFDKFHQMSNALFRFFTIFNEEIIGAILKNLNEDVKLYFNHVKQFTTRMNVISRYIEDHLNVFFEKKLFLIELSSDFKNEIQQFYEKKSTGKKLREKIKTRSDENDIIDEIDFLKINDLLYYAFSNVTRKLIIPQNKKKKIFELMHDHAHHERFHKTYVKLKNPYIRHVDKKLRRYITHCRICNEEQTKKHVSYDELNSIKTVALFFHTIVINFVIVLSLNIEKMNSFMSIIDKFFKKISLTSKKTTGVVLEGTSTGFDVLHKKTGNFSRIIISDKNKKFLSKFGRAIFHHFGIKLNYITTYHSNANGQSERTNQTMKIIMRFALMKENVTNFTRLLFFIQHHINNFINAFIGFFSNQILYEFNVAESTNLLIVENARIKTNDENSQTFLKEKKNMIRSEIEKTISFAQIMQKIKYDSRHRFIDGKIDDKVYIRLHKEYNQSSHVNKKFNKQKIRFDEIVEKIKKFAYRLKFYENGQIHSIVFVIQLKSISNEKNLYEKKIKESNSIEIQKGISDSNIYEIEKIIAKKTIHIDRKSNKKFHEEGRVKYLEGNDHCNEGKIMTDLQCFDLLKEFEEKKTIRKKK